LFQSAGMGAHSAQDLDLAFGEIRRVLRPGGRFFASTIGRTHLRELDELVHRFDAGADPWGGDLTDSFLLENGPDQLSEWFSRVTLHRYEDALVITEAEPLVAYVLSSAAKPALIGKERELVEFVERELALHGAIYVTKDSGLFEAFRDDGGYSITATNCLVEPVSPVLDEEGILA
jgi:SAM-dependent methyltransferase